VFDQSFAIDYTEEGDKFSDISERSCSRNMRRDDGTKAPIKHLSLVAVDCTN
jgi:hypothetical protein